MARPEYPPPPQCECRGECFAELAGVPVVGCRERRRHRDLATIAIAIALLLALAASAIVIAIQAGVR
jgi:hypothetical protein